MLARSLHATLTLAVLCGGCSSGLTDGSDVFLGDTSALKGSPQAGPIGAGDDVLDPRPGAVIPAFHSTAAGVVAAALWELHRGEPRGLIDVLGDETLGRVLPGPEAAIEGTAPNGDGLNWDAPATTNIAHTYAGSQLVPIGPIRTYLRTNEIYGPAPWCGAFVTYVYRRAGIAINTLRQARNVPRVLAALGENTVFYHLTGEEVRVDPTDPNSAVTFSGQIEQGQPSLPAKFDPIETQSLYTLDIRPGDVMWWVHADGTGHVGLVAGVSRHEDEVDCVTIEGNVDDRLAAHVRRLRRVGDGFIADWKGWGRPPQLQLAPISDHLLEEAPWVAAAIEGLPGTGGDDQ